MKNLVAKGLGVSGLVLAGVASGFAGFAATSASDASVEYKTTSAGTTIGALSGTARLLDLSEVPDLVRVVGDNGRVGYASSALVLGADIEAPSSPTEALAGEGKASLRVPVYDEDGITVIDYFTVQTVGDDKDIVLQR
ncbi:hypothetical protein GCM10027425_33800 [Alteromonas gracilis]